LFFFLLFFLSQTNGKPSIIYLGQPVNPKCPFKLAKHVRCPGNRKLSKSINKMPGNVIRRTSEYDTSNNCGRCFKRFPAAMKNMRYKVCENCVLNANDWPETLQPPTKIVTVKNTEMLRLDRDEWVDAAIEQNPNLNREQTQRDAQRYVSKVICYRKNWQQIDAATEEDEADGILQDLRVLYITNEDGCEVDVEPQNQRVLKTVWHRDISAAKLILYRGKLCIELQLTFEFKLKVRKFY
jgi:hypothetical protein